MQNSRWRIEIFASRLVCKKKMVSRGCGMVKIHFMQNSKWQTTAILKMLKQQ